MTTQNIGIRKIHRAFVSAALFSIFFLFAGITAAMAIPPGGASPNTPGTSSTISPGQLRAGDRINFTVHGFPAGELINIKIDDGLNCTESATHGACVYHQQRIPSNGVVSGSFALPADLSTGSHSLRFLAAENMPGGQGVKGYTLRSSNFQILAPNTVGGGGSSGGGNSGGSGGGNVSSGGGNSSSGNSVSSGGNTVSSTNRSGSSNVASGGNQVSGGNASAGGGRVVTGGIVQQPGTTQNPGMSGGTTGELVEVEPQILTIGQVDTQTKEPEAPQELDEPETNTEAASEVDSDSAVEGSQIQAQPTRWVDQVPWIGMSIAVVLIGISVGLMYWIQSRNKEAEAE